MRIASSVLLLVITLTSCTGAATPAAGTTPTAAAPTWTPTATAANSQLPHTSSPALTFAPTPTERLLYDDFTSSLGDNWISWGEPQAMIRKATGGNWLELSGIDPRYQSGVTSRIEIPFLPGVNYRFAAQIPPEWLSRDAWLVLDWDPRPGVEAGRIYEGSIIRLLIFPESATIYTRETDLECNVPLDGSQEHTYHIVLTGILSVAWYIDGASEPACQMEYTDSIYEIARQGPLTLTGAGWVSFVEVLR